MWEFEAALAAGDLERAVGLYAGPFLDGFYVGGDSLEFDAWAASERERLARAHLGALERLAEGAAIEGDPRRSAEWWRRLCAEDRDNSRAVLGLMQALAAGDRAGALQPSAQAEALSTLALDVIVASRSDSLLRCTYKSSVEDAAGRLRSIPYGGVLRGPAPPLARRLKPPPRDPRGHGPSSCSGRAPS